MEWARADALLPSIPFPLVVFLPFFCFTVRVVKRHQRVFLPAHGYQLIRAPQRILGLRKMHHGDDTPGGTRLSAPASTREGE